MPCLRIMYIMTNRLIPKLGSQRLSRLIQIGTMPIILISTVPFHSVTYKLLIFSGAEASDGASAHCISSSDPRRRAGVPL
jgi:hypothetical protein